MIKGIPGEPITPDIAPDPTDAERAAIARVVLRQSTSAPRSDSTNHDLEVAQAHPDVMQKLHDVTSGHSEPTNPLPNEQRVEDAPKHT